MDEIKEREKKAEEYRAQGEELDAKLTVEEKKRMIREAKQMYGRDWKKMVGGAVKGVGKLRVDKEALQDLHTMGFGGSELRDLSNPSKWQKH